MLINNCATGVTESSRSRWVSPAWMIARRMILTWSPVCSSARREADESSTAWRKVKKIDASRPRTTWMRWTPTTAPMRRKPTTRTNRFTATFNALLLPHLTHYHFFLYIVFLDMTLGFMVVSTSIANKGGNSGRFSVFSSFSGFLTYHSVSGGSVRAGFNCSFSIFGQNLAWEKNDDWRKVLMRID